MGQHRALGHARGATGVLQHGDVLQADPHRFQRMALALLQHLLEVDRLGQVVVRDHLLHRLHHGIHQPALQARQQVPHARLDQVLDPGFGQHLFDQAAEQVDVDQRAHPGVLELVTHLAGGVQRIGVDHDEPGAQGAEHGDGVLQDVGHLHGDAVAGRQVGVLLQVGGEGGGQPVQLGIGQGHAQVAEGRAVGEFLAGPLEHFDHRLIGGQIDLVGHAGRAFVAPEIRLHCSYPHSPEIVWPALRDCPELSSSVAQRKYASGCH
ncbi:hypothetical protein D9M70_182320 [compost metagenome]